MHAADSEFWTCTTDARLASYLDSLGTLLWDSRQRHSFATYALGLLSDLERKTAEAIAAASTPDPEDVDPAHQRLLHCLADAPYGHKVCVSFGKSGVVLAAQVLRYNPADATLAGPAVEQIEQNTGRTPHDAAMDLGFASRANVRELKARGVQRVAFPPGHGIDGQAACGSRRVRRKLHRFRAGVEGLISWLKRDLAMGRSRWKSEQGFCAYVWSVLVTATLQAMAPAS